jgi:predicted RNase H-like HicB family nuclease
MQRQVVHALIRPGEQSGFVAECPELCAVTQGKTLDEVAGNLREVVALALEGEGASEIGLARTPTIVVTFELEPAVA